jgi:hypothetical protein
MGKMLSLFDEEKRTGWQRNDSGVGRRGTKIVSRIGSGS